MPSVERQSLESKLEKVGNVLRLTGWIGLSAQIVFGAVALLMILFAISGRNFSQANALTRSITPGVAVQVNQGVTQVGQPHTFLNKRVNKNDKAG